MNIKKIKELEQIIKQAQEQIRELKKEEEPKFEYPKNGTHVYYVTPWGTIVKFKWDDVFECDKARYKQGNIFLTKEGAEFEIERRKVIKELELFKEPEDREWDMNNIHYCLSYSYINDDIVYDFEQCSRADNIYFATEEDCQKAIDFVGKDRVKKYYLRIKE